jgi:hypothetical protein
MGYNWLGQAYSFKDLRSLSTSALKQAAQYMKNEQIKGNDSESSDANYGKASMIIQDRLGYKAPNLNIGSVKPLPISKSSPPSPPSPLPPGPQN